MIKARRWACRSTRQRTYSEWLGSAYAVQGDNFQSCQDCHMSAVEGVPAAGCLEYEGLGYDSRRARVGT